MGLDDRRLKHVGLGAVLVILAALSLAVWFAPVDAPLEFPAFRLHTVDTAGTVYLVGAILQPPDIVPKPTAIGIWQDTVAKSPKKPRPHAWLGYAYMDAGFYEEALDEFGAVYDLSFQPGLHPDTADTARLNAQTNIANILRLQNRWPEFGAYVREAWNRHPGYPAFGHGVSWYLLMQAAPLSPGDPLRQQYIDFSRNVATVSLVELPNYPTIADLWAGKLHAVRGLTFQMEGQCAKANTDFALARRDPDMIQLPDCERNP